AWPTARAMASRSRWPSVASDSRNSSRWRASDRWAAVSSERIERMAGSFGRRSGGEGKGRREAVASPGIRSVVELQLLERGHGRLQGATLAALQLQRRKQAGGAGGGLLQQPAQGLGLGQHLGQAAALRRRAVRGTVGRSRAVGVGSGHGVVLLRGF